MYSQSNNTVFQRIKQTTDTELKHTYITTYLQTNWRQRQLLSIKWFQKLQCYDMHTLIHWMIQLSQRVLLLRYTKTWFSLAMAKRFRNTYPQSSHYVYVICIFTNLCFWIKKQLRFSKITALYSNIIFTQVWHFHYVEHRQKDTVAVHQFVILMYLQCNAPWRNNQGWYTAQSSSPL